MPAQLGLRKPFRLEQNEQIVVTSLDDDQQLMVISWFLPLAATMADARIWWKIEGGEKFLPCTARPDAVWGEVLELIWARNGPEATRPALASIQVRPRFRAHFCPFFADDSVPR